MNKKTMLNSIKAKLLGIALLPVLMTVIVTSVLMVVLIKQNGSTTIQSVEKSILDEKKLSVKNQVMTMQSVIKEILASSPNQEQAKKDIIKLASKARFNNGSGYFFAFEKKADGYYYAFHGAKAELNNQPLDLKKEDKKGFSFRKALIDTKNSDNEFIEYFYQKPNSSAAIKKIAFSKEIPELNWILVTGSYADDVELKVAQIQNGFDENLNIFMSIMGVLTVVCMSALAIIILFISKWTILKPLSIFEEGLLNFLSFINKEKKDVDLIPIKWNDEIGHMTYEINENILKIKEHIKQDEKVIEDVTSVVSEVSSGVLTQKVQATTNNEVIAQLTQNINEMIDNLNHILCHGLEVLNQYENKDFTVKTSMKCKGEMCKLLGGIDNLGNAITVMLKDNLNSGNTLNHDANTLNESVHRLTVSANQQAASLEESAASLEEITQTMRENSNNMEQLSSNAIVLKDSVTSGQAFANDTMSSMDAINEQVEAINESITVIDQIAFQTNILSLNAAVEASTAGEAGKGFAVVATEVRNLATRSAEAAKEIKNLVEKATFSSNNGKEIVNKMYEGYETLNESITQTTQIIDVVSTNSREQMIGIEQINTAISQLDAATQENASVAASANTIAKSVQNLATDVVEDVNSNKF